MVALFEVYLGLLVLAPLIRSFERRRGPPKRLDLAYWIVSPIFTGALTRAVTLGAFGVLGMLLGRATEDGFSLFPSPIRNLALASQLLLGLALGDGIGYWSHRLRHRWLWRFHRIHHGPTDLEALSAARMHPLDELLDGTAIGLGLLAAGFDWRVFSMIGPINLLYTLLSHADVDWGFGALGQILVSPRFHRWHHDLELGQRGVNFAGIFAIWDRIFGTFHLPPEEPARLGVEGPISATLAGQLIDPFFDRGAG